MTEVFPTSLGAGPRERTRTCVSPEDPPSSHVLVSVQAKLRWRNCISSQRASVASSQVLVTLMKEALSSFETSVLTRATRHKIPEDDILHIYRRENLKSYID
jgi:hypothetical protein